MTPVLIAIAGWTSAGKDTISDYLQSEYRFNVVGFADPIDAMLVEFGKPDAYYLASGQKDQPIAELGGRSARHFKQSLGDWIRHEFGNDALIDIVRDVCRDVKAAGECIVVRDVRRREEVQMVRELGGVMWWLQRPGTKAVNDHHTEAYDQLRKELLQKGDIVLNNHGSIHNLHSQIENALVLTQRRKVPA